MSDSQNLFLDPANPLVLRYVISGLLRGNLSVKLEYLFCFGYIQVESTTFLHTHYRSGKYEGKKLLEGVVSDLPKDYKANLA